ncbi:MAG: formylglycine-generating enzyme family protein [Kiritimatiellae bacterium]|nr:formylglycine-generating enzyme family protein [Kiritimatiellia bacterium]
MKRLLAATVLLAAGLLSAATVDNVSVRQRWPWSQKVDITYNLTTDRPQQIDVAVYQGDARVPMPDAAFSGDRHNVESGARHIVFDPSLTPYTNRVMTALRFEVTAREMPLYVVFDLSKPKTDPEQVTWITAYDLTNSASAYGAWEWGSAFHTGGEIDSRWKDTVVWTGVTNGTAYKTSKLVMRYVPPGTFSMGAAGGIPSSWNYDWWRLGLRQHNVTLTKGFYAAVFPTTTGQNSYITNLVSMTPSTVTSPRRWDNYNRLRGADLGAGWPASAAVDPDSIVGVLRAKTGYETFDLPTEAQWEYACRAGATGWFYDGSSTIAEDGSTSETLDLLAWYKNTDPNNYYMVPGQKQPNGWGFYDMLGNVNELCLDWVGGSGSNYPSGDATDPQGLASGSSRAIRGGTVWAQAKFCHCAFRASMAPDVNDGSNSPTLGYRFFLTIP